MISSAWRMALQFNDAKVKKVQSCSSIKFRLLLLSRVLTALLKFDSRFLRKTIAGDLKQHKWFHLNIFLWFTRKPGEIDNLDSKKFLNKKKKQQNYGYLKQLENSFSGYRIIFFQLLFWTLDSCCTWEIG